MFVVICADFIELHFIENIWVMCFDNEFLFYTTRVSNKNLRHMNAPEKYKFEGDSKI